MRQKQGGVNFNLWVCRHVLDNPVHSVQFRQETQSQNGVDNGPVRSKSRLLWTSNNIEEWLNARQVDMGKNLARVTEKGDRKRNGH